MKRILALLLAAVMLLMLCACGGDDDNKDKDSEKDEETVEDVNGETQEDKDEDEDETTETETDTETEAADSDAEGDTEGDTEGDEVIDISSPIVGDVSGNVYANEFFGIGCELSTDWHVADQEEMATIMGWTVDALGGDEFEKALEQSGFVFSFYATASEGLVSLNVGIENLGVLYGLMLSEEEYIDISVPQLPAALEAIGVTGVTTEKTVVELAGAEHPAVLVKGDYYGTPLCETIVAVKSGNYMAVVTAASYVEDITDTILGEFYAVLSK